VTSILHVSDLHFGWPAVPEQIDAVEALIAGERYDVVAVSGDLSQRARAGELQRGAAFLRDAGRVSQTITVPGNHDVAWWFAPLGVGDRARLYAKYWRYVSPILEPVLHVPGATFVGLNTALGVAWDTLTWRPRDISIVGALRPSQLAHAAKEFQRAPAGDARVIVMHHNPMRGELSQRHGLRGWQRALDAFGAMHVDLVLCGHDHQEAVHYVEHTHRGTVISTAGTISSRSRGGRPSSVNAITLTDTAIDIRTFVWSPSTHTFEPGPAQCFARSN
jgi:3',5'-cyclic AMP phosphodiesterase CpdA